MEERATMKSPRRTSRMVKPSLVYKEYVNSTSNMRRNSVGSKMQVRTNNVEEAAIETASCLPPAIEHTNDDDKSLIKSVKTDGHNLSSGSTSQSRTKDLSEQKEERKHFNSEKGGVASTPESTSTTTEDQEINKVYLCRFSGANSHFCMKTARRRTV